MKSGINVYADLRRKQARMSPWFFGSLCLILLSVLPLKAAEETLLLASFSEAAAGPIKKGDSGCASVTNTEKNLFEIADSVGDLQQKSLKLVKEDGAIKGRPIIFWRMPEAQGGVIRIEWDAVIESFTPGEKYPGGEHLLCLNVIGTQGRVVQAMRMAAKGGDGKGVFDLLGKNATGGVWVTGKSNHLKYELDQENKKCRLLVDGKTVVDNVAFEGGSVLAFNFRDGGGWGCYDGTFTAGVANLKVTHVTAGDPQVGGARKVRVACCGDSITLGVCVQNPEVNSYPAVLQKLLGNGYDVRNFGVGGRTLLRKAAAYSFGDGLRFRPDIVLIMLGTNDSRQKTWKEHGNEFVPDYNTIIQEFKRMPNKPRIYLCLPPPMFPGRWKLSETVLAEKAIPAIREVATANGLPVINLHDPLMEEKKNFPDTVHPNATVAAKIADIIAVELKKDK